MGKVLCGLIVLLLSLTIILSFVLGEILWDKLYLWCAIFIANFSEETPYTIFHSSLGAFIGAFAGFGSALWLQQNAKHKTAKTMIENAISEISDILIFVQEKLRYGDSLTTTIQTPALDSISSSGSLLDFMKDKKYEQDFNRIMKVRSYIQKFNENKTAHIKNETIVQEMKWVVKKLSYALRLLYKTNDKRRYILSNTVIPEKDSTMEIDDKFIKKLKDLIVPELMQNRYGLKKFLLRIVYECENIRKIGCDKNNKKVYKRTKKVVENLESWKTARNLVDYDIKFHKHLFEIAAIRPKFFKEWRKVSGNMSAAEDFWKMTVEEPNKCDDLLEAHKRIIDSIVNENENDAIYTMIKHFAILLPQRFEDMFVTPKAEKRCISKEWWRKLRSIFQNQNSIGGGNMPENAEKDIENFIEILLKEIKKSPKLKCLYFRLVKEVENIHELISALKEMSVTERNLRLRELKKIFDKFDSETDYKLKAEEDKKFHEKLFKIAGNKDNLEWWESQDSWVGKFLANFWLKMDSKMRTKLMEVHKNIFEAIKNEDKDKAVDSMMEHFAILLIHVLDRIYLPKENRG